MTENDYQPSLQCLEHFETRGRHLERSLSYLKYVREFESLEQLEAGCKQLLIAVPTTASGDSLRNLICKLDNAPADVLLLLTEGEEAEFQIGRLGHKLSIRIVNEHKHANWAARWPSLGTGLQGSAPFDLALKRNFALVKGVEQNYRVVFFLDDDISGLYHSDLLMGAAIAEKCGIFGIRCGYFPDDSCVGHIRRMLGMDWGQFVGGGCLFVSLLHPLGIFPRLYNEDWLFIFSSSNSSIATYSNKFVAQRSHNRWAEPRVASWQECGDLVGESIMMAHADGLWHETQNEQFWTTRIQWRSENLRRMLTLLQTPDLRSLSESLLASLQACRSLEAGRLRDFSCQLHDDSVTFRRCLGLS